MTGNLPARNARGTAWWRPRWALPLLAATVVAASVVAGFTVGGVLAPGRLTLWWAELRPVSPAGAQHSPVSGGDEISGAAPHAARVLRGIAYAGGSPAQSLDLYLPQQSGRAVPLVISIHGGGFVSGDKAKPKEYWQTLLNHGYAVASVNYRLTAEAQFPAGVQDAKAAVRWLRANAGQYGIDPDRFAAWGTSAGGYLAAMLGVTGDQTTRFDDATLGNPSVSSAVQAVVDWYGPVDFATMDEQATAQGGCDAAAAAHGTAGSPESRWLGSPVAESAARVREASPISYLAGARHLPPFAIAHGDHDCTVPYRQSSQLVDALHALRARATFTLVPGAGHGGPGYDWARQAEAIEFLDGALGEPS